MPATSSFSIGFDTVAFFAGFLGFFSVASFEGSSSLAASSFLWAVSSI
jgi:hypothetical protein